MQETPFSPSSPTRSDARAGGDGRAGVGGVILAGGRAVRMGGGDKTLRVVAGATLLSRVVAGMRRQTDVLFLNAAGDPARFAGCGLPVVADAPDVAGAGPLAGVATALERLRADAPHCRLLLTAAADTPLFPADLAARLLDAATAAGAPVALAASGGRVHPTFGLWSVDLADDLRRMLTGEGERRVGVAAARFGAATAHWPDRPYDPFFNVNVPADLTRLEAILAAVPP